MSPILTIVIVGIGTYLIRISSIVGLERVTIPRSFEQTLRLIAPAVMGSLIANFLVFDDGAVRPFGPVYVAALITVGIGLWTRSMGWTLLGGLLAYWLLEAVF